jgi:hypothetical protein
MAKLLDISLFSIVDLDSSLGVGWKLNVYVPGTSTRLDTFPTLADAEAVTNANSNPLVIASDGRLAAIWHNADAKLVLTDENDVVKETVALVPVSSGNTNVEEVETSGAVLQGVHTIPVLVGSMIANTTNGPSSGTSESATHKVMLRTLDYDASTDESAQITIPMPKSWDEGTVTVQFIWMTTNTGNVVWGCAARAFSDDDLIDAAFGTAVTVTDAVTATTDIMESAFTSAITIAGTPAAEDLVIFKFYRDADNAADTLAVDAKLIAVRIKYTIDVGTDA